LSAIAEPFIERRGPVKKGVPASAEHTLDEA
jgi:hypothetical protein